MSPDAPFRWSEPTTWPWFVWFWVVLLVAGWLQPVWRWLLRRRIEAWPTTQGRIESTELIRRKVFSSAQWGNSDYTADIRYSYSVAGTTNSGRYKRGFPTEQEAKEFVRDLQGTHVVIHYDPNKPPRSALRDSDIEALLQTRCPLGSTDSASADTEDVVLSRLRPFLRIFVWLSATGLIVSLWVHVEAVAGRHVASSAAFILLHMGIFAVWIPAVIVAQRRVGSVNRRNFWEVVLKGSPEWMRYMVYAFLAYAVVNLMLFILTGQIGNRGEDNPASTWRGFSGHWMAFYSCALAIFYAADRAQAAGPRCVNGHQLLRHANYCTRCGQPAAPVHRSQTR